MISISHTACLSRNNHQICYFNSITFYFMNVNIHSDINKIRGRVLIAYIWNCCPYQMTIIVRTTKNWKYAICHVVENFYEGDRGASSWHNQSVTNLRNVSISLPYWAYVMSVRPQKMQGSGILFFSRKIFRQSPYENTIGSDSLAANFWLSDCLKYLNK